MKKFFLLLLTLIMFSCNSKKEIIIKNINEDIKMNTFQFKILDIEIADKIDVGKQYLSLDKKNNSKYLIITREYKNISNKTEYSPKGVIMADYNKQVYEFDKQELISADGWREVTNSINPLEIIKDRVVFTIPEELKDSNLYYHLNNEANMKVYLGKISEYVNKTQYLRKNEELLTRFFKVKLKNITICKFLEGKTINTSLFPKEDKFYIMLEADFTNLDLEKRNLGSGKIVIKTEKKEFIFDNSEPFGSNFTYVSQGVLEPGETKNCTIVFCLPIIEKISSEKNEKMSFYYIPYSSKENTGFFLGKIN